MKLTQRYPHLTIDIYPYVEDILEELEKINYPRWWDSFLKSEKRQEGCTFIFRLHRSSSYERKEFYVNDYTRNGSGYCGGDLHPIHVNDRIRELIKKYDKTIEVQDKLLNVEQDFPF